MARDIVSSDNVDLESSGRRDYWVALGHTSVWSSHLIPLTVIVGPQARAGQGLVAFGGNHGNEYDRFSQVARSEPTRPGPPRITPVSFAIAPP